MEKLFLESYLQATNESVMKGSRSLKQVGENEVGQGLVRQEPLRAAQQ